jgi:hypothetical protein
MKLATLALGCAAILGTGLVFSQTADVRIEGQWITTVAGTGGLECRDCVVTFAASSPVTMKATSVRRDLATGTTELSGSVELTHSGGRLLADSATVTSEADGSVVVRARHITLSSSGGR